MAGKRGVARELMSLIVDEANEVATQLRAHICATYRKKGGCVICLAAHAKTGLLYTALARKFELLGEELLNSEQVLLELVGETKVRNMVKEQARMFFSGPEKRCGCGTTTKFYGSYHQLYFLMKQQRDTHRYRVVCHHCGDNLYFTLTEVQDIQKKVEDRAKRKASKEKEALENALNIENKLVAVLREVQPTIDQKVQEEPLF